MSQFLIMLSRPLKEFNQRTSRPLYLSHNTETTDQTLKQTPHTLYARMNEKGWFVSQKHKLWNFIKHTHFNHHQHNNGNTNKRWTNTIEQCLRFWTFGSSARPLFVPKVLYRFHVSTSGLRWIWHPVSLPLIVPVIYDHSSSHFSYSSVPIIVMH